MITKVLRKLTYDVDFSPIDIELIELNTIVPYDIYVNKEGAYDVIVEAGTMIDQAVYDTLLAHSIFIAHDDIGKEKLDFNNLIDYINQAKDNYEYCIKLLYKMSSIFFDNFSKSKNYKFDARDVEGIVLSVIFLLEHDKEFVKKSMVYFKSDNLLEVHSLHVCIYALNLGYALDFSEVELLDLGIAGYLQDIGLKKIDESVVEKDSQLSAPELADIQKHTLYSVQMIQLSRIHRPDIIDGIKHHHENYDGSGYPDGLKKEKISKFAAILSICDVFDALTSIRSYRENKSSFEALSFMMKEPTMVNRFNHQYIKKFISLLVK